MTDERKIFKPQSERDYVLLKMLLTVDWVDEYHAEGLWRYAHVDGNVDRLIAFLKKNEGKKITIDDVFNWLLLHDEKYPEKDAIKPNPNLIY